MSLDISTPKGQQSLREERECLIGLAKIHPEFQFIETPKDEPADIDGIISRRGVMVAAFETKSRKCNLAQMRQWNNEWLVTYEKISHGCEIARKLCIKFVGFLYLVNEPAILSVQICDKNGNIIPKMRIERTTTQRTVNGGEIERTNAYIDLSNSRLYRL
jgi:hypothetical protein